MEMKNLIAGIELPVTDEKLAEVCALLEKRLETHAEVYKIERSAPLAMLHSLQQRCTHPGARRGHNERDGSWMAKCPICGKSE